MRPSRKKRAGFSLIEMLLVLIVIGLLVRFIPRRTRSTGPLHGQSMSSSAVATLE